MGGVSGPMDGHSNAREACVPVPAGTPEAIVQRLQAEIAKVMLTQEAQEQLAALGGEVLASTPAEFSQHIRDEIERWREVISKMGIRIQG